MNNITYTGELRKVLSLFKIGVTVEDTSTSVGRFRESSLFDPFLVSLIEQFNPVYRYGPFEFEPGVKLDSYADESPTLDAHGPGNVMVRSCLTFHTCEMPDFAIYRNNRLIRSVSSRHEFQHKFIKIPENKSVLGMLERGWVDYKWMCIREVWNLICYAAYSEYRFADVVEHLFTLLPPDDGPRDRYIQASSNIKGLIVCCKNQVAVMKNHIDDIVSYHMKTWRVWFPKATAHDVAAAHNPRLFQYLFAGEKDYVASLVDVDCLKTAVRHGYRPTPEQLIGGDPANIQYAVNALRLKWEPKHLQYALDNNHVKAATNIAKIIGFSDVKFPEAAYENEELFLAIALYLKFDFQKMFNYACKHTNRRIYDCLTELFPQKRAEMDAISRMMGWRPYCV